MEFWCYYFFFHIHNHPWFFHFYLMFTIIHDSLIYFWCSHSSTTLSFSESCPRLWVLPGQFSNVDVYILFCFEVLFQIVMAKMHKMSLVNDWKWQIQREIIKKGKSTQVVVMVSRTYTHIYRYLCTCICTNIYL